MNMDFEQKKLNFLEYIHKRHLALLKDSMSEGVNFQEEDFLALADLYFLVPGHNQYTELDIHTIAIEYPYLGLQLATFDSQPEVVGGGKLRVIRRPVIVLRSTIFQVSKLIFDIIDLRKRLWAKDGKTIRAITLVVSPSKTNGLIFINSDYTRTVPVNFDKGVWNFLYRLAHAPEQRLPAKFEKVSDKHSLNKVKQCKLYTKTPYKPPQDIIGEDEGWYFPMVTLDVMPNTSFKELVARH